jgi:pyruvate,orthophosphate dikinase
VTTQYVYFFGGGKADGNRDMKDLLGGKGSGLAEMTNAGLPVPPGFTVSTAACNLYMERGGSVPPEIDEQIEVALGTLEDLMGKKLGAADDPLLVSVRSGAKFSMPGMMDTILNLGLNDDSVLGLKTKTGNGRFAKDSYRRFIQMFGNVVLGIDKDRFEHELHAVKAKNKVAADVDLTEAALDDVIARYKAAVQKETGAPFPQDPRSQLTGARDAVFKSWGNPRAVTYRKLNDIPHDIGTAVNVQSMVFGNMGDSSATGVGFTRNPSTGGREFYGEFLLNAQGEDVVAGIRTPLPITDLEKVLPEAYLQLREITTRLERHYKDVQDFEFTIQDSTLYMLQTRNGKRTGVAAVHIAVDLVEEGILTKKEAVMKVEPAALDQLLHPIFDPKERAKAETAATGLPASPGAATGAIVFTADEAVTWSQKGKRVVLVRMETVPDDIHGMSVAQGILTATGGMTSHAAVVGRQMGKPSVVGCGALHIDGKGKTLKVAGRTLREGDLISIDGTTGDVILKELPTSPSEVLQVVAGKLKPEKSPLYQKFEKLLGWADEIRRLGIRANADIPRDAKVAFAFGARGIGLCRTEHMFFADDRLPHVVKMILLNHSIFASSVTS